MKFRGLAALALFVALAGCGLIDKLCEKVGPVKSEPPFSQYHLNGFYWDGVGRVVVLAFLNESDYTRAGDEVRAAFTSEFQRLGRFEVVAGPQNDQAPLAAHIHRNGEFDEAEMLCIARETRADVVIHGIVTQYSPYPRPRLGLILQAVGPKQAKVVASVDGLWDTTDKRISDRLRAFYRQRPRDLPIVIRNNVISTDDAFAAEISLESPALFQRFVCHEASLALLGLTVPGIDCAYPAAMPPMPPTPPGSGLTPQQQNPKGNAQPPAGNTPQPTNAPENNSAQPGPPAGGKNE
jgi:hypothetical protein